jgi:hypothetical protein
MVYCTYGILVIYCGQLICFMEYNPSLVRNVGHVLVLSVEHTYNTYEIMWGGGRFDFELEMICLVANWIHMVNYVFYGKMFGSLGALHTWLWLMEINVKRGETTCIYCTSFLPYLEVATFTILALVLVALVSIASVFLGLWKNSGALSFLAFSLQVCWLLSLHS